jgi:arginyl-tRNA synthetase
MLKAHCRQVLQAALIQALANNGIVLPKDVDKASVGLALIGLNIERPRQTSHGDFAVNVSSLAKLLRVGPPVIAQALAEAVLAVATNNESAQAIGGFVNITLGTSLLAKVLLAGLQTASPGQSTCLAHERFLIEFVSANPTGPLHVGHGRWAALGDSIRRILKHCGASVDSEFYINDAGTQMRQLAHSLWWRCAEQALPEAGLGFPEKPDPIEGQPPVKYAYYPGEYLIDLATSYLSSPERLATFTATWEACQHRPPEAIPEADWPTSLLDLLFAGDHSLQSFARHAMLAEQQALLRRMGVPFEVWLSEKSAIHDTGLLTKTLDTIRQTTPNAIYQQDGALWFRSSDYGDEKDRVLQKSAPKGYDEGPYTYLTADIAYHHLKYQRTLADGTPQYNRYLNIWGADHHGYIARLKAAIEVLGHPTKHFEVLLGQLVNLVISGEKTRMGKRKTMVMLADVLDDVGVDATRFWMVSKSADTTLDFDVDLAASASDENPVFYAQYAHARCSGIVRNVIDERLNTATQTTEPALCSVAELATYQKNLTWEQLTILFEPDQHDTSNVLKALLIRLDSFDDVVKEAARHRSPHLIARFTLDLAADFHSFYNVCRIITPTLSLTQARLMVVLVTRKVLAKALYLLGVSAPDTL